MYICSVNFIDMKNKGEDKLISILDKLKIENVSDNVVIIATILGTLIILFLR